MNWTYLGLAAALQLGWPVHALAIFDGTGIRSLGGFLVGRAQQADIGVSARLDQRQAGGQCGASAGGAKCPDNLCCSEFGYCGNDDTYCAQIAGCQSAYGLCDGEPLPSTSSTTTTSTIPITTPSSSTTTTSSTSSVSSTAPATSTTPPYTGPFQVSQDGMWGNDTTCAGSRFGSCCSEFYYCGSGSSFCGVGCQAQFGSCGVPGGSSTVTVTSTVTMTSSITVSVGSGTIPMPITTTVTQTITVGGSGPTGITSTPTTTSSTGTSTSSAPTTSVSIPAGLRTTTDGTCGDGVTCIGYSGGQCCSQWGYCGDDAAYCSPNLGCQARFGICSTS